MSGDSAITDAEQSAAAEAAEILRGALGPDATFRPGQLETIVDIVVGHRRVLLVQSTGWGKSFVYFIATAMLRRRGYGTTLLISPLLSLMRNQVAMAQRIGIRAADFHSGNSERHDDIVVALRDDEIDLLLVSPERLHNSTFRSEALKLLTSRPCLLVVDEAHCLSDWGHDFRPDYRLIANVLHGLPSTTPVLCTTATANDRVISDLIDQLGDGLRVVRGGLARASLRLSVVDLSSAEERLAWLATVVPTLPGTGIVYCLTVRDTRLVAEWLRQQGVDAVGYSGEDDPIERETIEQRLLGNAVKVVVATSALGMGFDKADLAFVVHYQAPGSVVAYYQQIGRAGRTLTDAPAILLRGAEDEEIQNYFISTAFPTRGDAEAVMALLEDRAGRVPLYDVLAVVNVRKSRLETMLKVLEAEGAVSRVRGGWERTLTPWTYDADHVERVTAQRRVEPDAMRRYGSTGTCLMQFLQQQLDDPVAKRCGRCDACTGQTVGVPLAPQLIAAALTFLRGQDLELKPRRQWPPGVPDRHGAISPEERLEVGRALSIYADAGWGRLVVDGKFQQGVFAEELVVASVTLIRERWQPAPWPMWVTCIPSTRHPTLVADFAARLAGRLGVPFVPCLRKERASRPQKEMENSTQQLRNVLGGIEITGSVRPEPVLLVDDIVDSGWTLTVAGTGLRAAGSGPVHPFVLAQARGQ
ncbi:MAG: RecQ family ATP-dependent DNA helicase [Candidatus Dormibacteraeota bacterium]|uniref:DNA 3'-5' helicase n=1 Tax=Candidatus Amunia macphersoniae TaxID=3127014 RepID=A0A934KD30_9BACT|nr:RecQ family ATP-dependent DNA helicase [Candidatus Dormibacteraeota bacterium]